MSNLNAGTSKETPKLSVIEAAAIKWYRAELWRVNCNQPGTTQGVIQIAYTSAAAAQMALFDIIERYEREQARPAESLQDK